MAKRSSHYRDADSSRKRGGSRGRKKNSRGGKKRSGKNEAKTSNTSGVPVGGGDLNNAELSDLDDGYGRSYISPSTVEDYYFNRSKKDKSMKMGGLRPGQRNASSSDLNNGGKANFRKRPMQFVKSKDVYDPSHDLIKQLQTKNRADPIQETIVLKEGEIDPEIDVEDNVWHENESKDTSTDELAAKKNSDFFKLDNNELFFIDEEGTSSKEPWLEIENEELESTEHKSLSNAREHSETITIGKIELTTQKDSSGELHVEIPNSKFGTSNPYGEYISNILQQMNPSSEEMSDNDSNFDEDEEYDNHVYAEEIPKVEEAVDMEEIEESLPGQSNDSAESRGPPELANNMQALHIEENDINSCEKVPYPEFGFLDEDFAVDLSEISVTNMRLGISDNSYFVKCFRLFADHEHRWISQDVFSDFVLEEIALPEHRLPAYLDFIKNSIIPKEEPPEPSFSDIPISDSSAEEEDDPEYPSRDSVTPDMREGLEDLIQYTEKYSYTRNQEYNTKSLPVTGKGMKKKLLIDDSVALDTESIATLEDKFRTRLESKADKRRSKEEFVDNANKNSEDLFKKYPVGLHVQNVKDEFELFMRRNKECLLFPPLDPHGNQTIMKFAKHYQTNSMKQGRGNKTHVMAQKTRKTNRNYPNYHLIDKLLRQRPVFMRIDIRKPKDTSEIKDKPKSKFHAVEGELVGKDAPEIGQENVGRKILEKLGWVDGEGLGAQGNKGISEPLMATVKKNKSGLRHTENRSG